MGSPYDCGMTDGPKPYTDSQERLLRLATRSLSLANRGLLWASGGRIGKSFKGAPVCLLTTTGRRSGRPRTVVLLYVEDGEDIVVIASMGGSRRSPDWYFNLVDEPNVEVEVDGKRRAMVARVAQGDERERLWVRSAESYPDYTTYKERTEREIPVVVCGPLG